MDNQTKKPNKTQSKIAAKRKKSTKRIITLTVLSMLLSLTFIGVAVFAAVSQSVSITNTITITSDGQAQTAVQVFEGSATKASQAAAFALTTPTSELTFSATASIDKLATENSKTGTLTPIEFSESSGKNWFGYKIVLTNSSLSRVNYTVNLYDTGTTNVFTPNEQVIISTAQGTAALAQSSSINGTLEKSATETVYVVISTNTELGNLTAASGTAFDMSISTSVA